MKKLLKKLTPRSHKLIVLMVAVALYVANDLAGQILSEEAMQSTLALFVAWLVGQGVADAGAAGKAKAIERAMGETEEFRALLVQVLGPGTKLAEKLDRTGAATPVSSAIDPAVADRGASGPGPLNG